MHGQQPQSLAQREQHVQQDQQGEQGEQGEQVQQHMGQEAPEAAIVVNRVQDRPAVMEMNENVVGSKVKTLWPDDNQW